MGEGAREREGRNREEVHGEHSTVHRLAEVLIGFPKDEFKKMSDEIPMELTLQMGRCVTRSLHHPIPPNLSKARYPRPHLKFAASSTAPNTCSPSPSPPSPMSP